MRLTVLILCMVATGCGLTPAVSAAPQLVVVPEARRSDALPPIGSTATEEASNPPASEVPAESAADECAAKDGDVNKKEELTCADRKAWRAILAWPETCEEAYDVGALRGSAGMEFHSIAPQRWIVKVECTLGAYQGYAVYFLRDESVSPPESALLSFRT